MVQRPSPAQGVHNVLEVVRSVVRAKVQPNHAWRYTFKTYAYDAGLDHLTFDAICGHAAKAKGNDYTKVTLKKRMEAIASFPRYKVTNTRRSKPHNTQDGASVSLRPYPEP